MRLEDIKGGDSLEGVEPAGVVTVAAVVAVPPDAVTLYYKLSDGTLRERLIGRADEAKISVATNMRPWSFAGDGSSFQIAAEAKRMDLAFLFDPMMAVHTSNVMPLPHQITAVYESMLPRQPLRYVLADDPGAGKTVMAGLYIRELLMRGDARRILIVSPGSLVEQWKDELRVKFGLEFRVYSKELELSAAGGNAFDSVDQLIIRLDQLSRDEDLQLKATTTPWDLVIFDEAHKLSAHFFGKEVTKTARYSMAERLGAATRHLLLMTATPHNGKEEDFQLFLQLLDSDRFYGKFRDGAHKVDTSDLMRRMVKEELVKFDGTPLFPERKAYTANYELSPPEKDLYERVTTYVRDQMDRAEKLKGNKKGSVGFALTALQRRLASSPEAIYQSLKRRHERLSEKLADWKQGKFGTPGDDALAHVPDDEDELDAEAQEGLEEELVDDASAAASVGELTGEVLALQALAQLAKKLVDSQKDRKWDELSRILQSSELHDTTGRVRKLIIFTEHRDTLNYLERRVGNVLPDEGAVATIHGGTPREQRLKTQASFRHDPTVRVLIATDAAGEGVNLQNASFMVNYDLPWNPNRLEQRFGRIHRIGQTEVCHLYNLVAKETREGAVYERLLKKLETERGALNGRVFDVLGEVFEETSLKDLLMDAVRYSDLPETRAKLTQKIDAALDPMHLKTILERNALAQESMTVDRLFAVKAEMEKAEARKLQPYFIRAFFGKAFEALGGTAHKREQDRLEITYVPPTIRERDRLISGRNRRELTPVVKKYERVCFRREDIRPDGPGFAEATLLHPGHPLMLAMTDLILEQNRDLLRQGAVLVDPTDDGDTPHLLFLLTHEITAGDGTVVSRRLQFVRVAPTGEARFAGWAPHLDVEPLRDSDRPLLSATLSAPWIHVDLERQAIGLAAGMLVPEHMAEVATRHTAQLEKTRKAVHERLTKEIDFQSDRYLKLIDDKKAGKDVGPNIEKTRRIVDELEARLEARTKELKTKEHISSATPVVLGGALVIPVGLLRRLRGDSATSDPLSNDAEARARIERIAMQAVRKAEETRGCIVQDVSAEKCGWDLTSISPSTDGKTATTRHLEVKGRIKGATTVTLTRNELIYALNQADKFALAIVLVNEDDSTEGPHYVRGFVQDEPGWGVAASDFHLKTLLSRAESQ